MDTARLVFFRRRTWQDALRNHRVYVDGELAGVLGPEGSLEVTVDPGAHRCRARISWTGSRAVDLHVEAGDTRRVLVAPGRLPAILKVLTRTRWLVLHPERPGDRSGR